MTPSTRSPGRTEWLRGVVILAAALGMLIAIVAGLVYGVRDSARIEGQNAAWTTWRDLNCRQVKERVEKSALSVRYPGVGTTRVRVWLCEGTLRYVEVDGKPPAGWVQPRN